MQLKRQRVAVVGAGSWGTALAIIAARAGHQVSLWSRNPAVVDSINTSRVNPVYLTGTEIPAGVRATGAFPEAVDGCSIVILSAPAQALRSLVVALAPHLDRQAVIVSAAKGIEVDTGKRISEMVVEVLRPRFEPKFVCLSGPSFAQEVVQNHPTAIAAASADSDAAHYIQSALSFTNLRIYTNDDVVGTELGGAVKNVMAIAAGMVSGLGFGSNTLAALITRGLAEIIRLAVPYGAQTETLMGLAGLGDLVLTCTGNLSRNRFVGVELGKGRSLEEIRNGMNEVAEGISTTLAVKQLADRAQLEMPITDQVKAVIYDGKSARDAVTDLMSRPLREETVTTDSHKLRREKVSS